MNINLYINKQSVRAEAPEVFSGSVGVLTVTLFGELDSSLIPVLRFMHESGEGYYTAKIENGCATVPHEVIHAPGFSIAVAGYENDGESVKRFLPTEAAYIPVKENGYGSPDDAVSEEEDSESLIGQILSECQSVRGEVTDAKNELNQKYSNLKNEFTDMGDALLGEEAERKKEDETLAEAVASENAARRAADEDLQTELDLEAVARKTGDDTVLEILEEEQEARQTADGTLLLRIVKEEEARQTADSELEERITNAESGIKAAEDELIVSIKSEAAERESSDIRLQTELDKKVDKEDGKGLSMTMDVYIENGYDSSPSVIETSRYGDITAQRIELYNKEQVDKKLAEFKPSQDVDLTEYVKKEEGKGLSTIADIMFKGDTDRIVLGTERYLDDGATSTNYHSVYSAEGTEKLLDNKVDKKNGFGLSNALVVDIDEAISSDRIVRALTISNHVGGTTVTYLYDADQIDEQLATVESIAKGRATGYVFDTYEAMTEWLADEANTGKLVLGDNLYIREIDVPDYWWDGTSAQQLETQKVDLSDYVQKEEGYDLSGVREVYVSSYTGELDDENYINLHIESQNGDETISPLYEKANVDNLLGKKQDKPTRENWQNEPSIEDGIYLLTLIDNTELNAVSNVLNLTINANYFPLLSEMYIAFTSGDELVITDNASISKWIGDDCDLGGVFTPQPNTSYEVSFKNTVGGIIARVGAC